MSSSHLGIPKGTRDFGPQTMAKRQFIFERIKSVFQKFAFQPLETPTMENLSVLTGKYGEEGDQLLYKILDSGDYLKKSTPEDYHQGASHLLPKIASKGLRYDLTVPFARFVAMNRHNITFPFKRYQMQPVWRADRPQRGRYREFYQCDADVVGTDSLLCEAEIVAMIDQVLTSLGITNYTIQVNHRQLLVAMSEAIGAPGREVELATALDKVQKAGLDKVEGELTEKGFSTESIDLLRPITNLFGEWHELKGEIADWKSFTSGKKGIDDLDKIFDYLDKMKVKSNVRFNASLARGLTYYTGTIFEVVVNNAKMGSICGGGRYDNLTDIFGLPDVSGVGISFGVDRIYDVMEQLSLFPEQQLIFSEVLLVALDEESESYALDLLTNLRDNGTAAELYPDKVKLKKALGYADKNNIPLVILIGSNEIQSGLLTIKHMKTGKQEQILREELLGSLKKVD